jgi:hypothetical protein
MHFIKGEVNNRSEKLEENQGEGWDRQHQEPRRKEKRDHKSSEYGVERERGKARE